jgi:hypothetical protein
MCFTRMNPPESRPARAALALDAVLTLVVFVFFTWILHTHVPSQDPFYIWLWGALSALCLTALFWLALQMFRVVLRAQREAKRQ